MAASLSEEEFQRMQMQLIDLRTKNYSLGEKNVKIQTELLQNNQSMDDMRKELAKCQKIISRSKGAREVEQLLQENDTLQRKLQMQEDEFRLQNETLMQEVSALVSSKSQMEKELEFSKSHTIMASNDLKLEAENIALKKLLEDNGSLSEGASLELDLKLKTLSEEKVLLNSNLKRIENELKEQILKFQFENDKLTDKLKKKQESFLQLQEEKEKLYTETKAAMKNLSESKEVEKNELKEKLHCMQSDLKNALQFNEDLSIDELAGEKVGMVEINGDIATFDYSLTDTKLSLRNIQDKITALKSQLSESELKVKNLANENEDSNKKVQSLEKALADSDASLAEKNQLAEQRRKIMDDMKNHLIETTNKQSVEIENLTRKLEEEQEAFKKLFDKEKETMLKLLESRSEVQSLKDEIDKLRFAHTNADDRIAELEEQIKVQIEEHELSVAGKEKEHACEVEDLKNAFASSEKDLTIQLEIAKAEKSEFEDKVKALEQEAKDSIDDRKIQEKKGLAMVKDLKRQLQVERNRAEKLQERLQEALNEQSRSVEEILQTSDKQKGDNSSISSWSYVSAERDVTLQSDASSGGHDSPSPVILETETSNLLAKITQLQQKNWTLEEKVNHLEMGNEALVEDVLKKTALIQYYCMEGRSDPCLVKGDDKLTIKRIVDFIKDRGDENLREINRRMQRMLEETLTKNMELLKHVETLSDEVSRLSKLAITSTENGIVYVDGV